MKKILQGYLTLALAFQALLCAAQCPGVTQSPLYEPFVTHNSGACEFELGGTAVTEGYELCLYSIECNTYMYRWLLFFKAPGSQNFSQVAAVCNDERTFSFNVNAVGDYKLMVVYKAYHGDCPCLVRVDEKIFTISDNVCAIISSEHNNNNSATIKRSFDFVANCAIANNKSTILLSTSKISLQPGFSSGTGSSTYFHAYIAECSSEAFRQSSSNNTSTEPVITAGSDDSTPSSDIKMVDIATGINPEIFFSIYPNPHTDQFNIALPAGEPISDVIIYDLLGRTVYHKEIREKELAVDIKMPLGVYHVLVRNGTLKYAAKAIRQ